MSRSKNTYSIRSHQNALLVFYVSIEMDRLRGAIVIKIVLGIKNRYNRVHDNNDKIRDNHMCYFVFF